MTVNQTTRLDLYTWSASEDEFTREQMTASHQSLEDNAAIFTSGTSATPPTASASTTRAFYWDTTNNILYFRGDDPWQQLFPVVAGGHVHSDLQPLSSNLTGLSSVTGTGVVSRTGTNTFATRSIAVSGTGLTITNADGSAGNPTISISTATAATANTVVLRDASGRFQAVSPSANADVAIKSYVDTADALKANAADVYTKTEMASPTVRATLNLQTLDADLTALSALTTTGIVSRTAADTYATRTLAVSGSGLSIANAAGLAGDPTITINSATAATASTVVFRDASGRFQAASPSVNADVAIKSYVDTADALKANAADVYTKTEMADPTVRATLNLQTLDADLTAISALTTTGFVSRTAADTYATRTIAVSGTGLSITNAAGLAGNPTIAIASDTTATASTIVLRDAAGRFQAVSPSANADVAIKSYVDTADALKANSADVYTKTDLHNAKLYQYGNTAGGTGTALPSTGTRTTPRIYVQSTDPGTTGAITGDIWFQI